MKILMISNIFPPGFIGGYELGAFDVARGLQARGHRVEVLTSDYFEGDDESTRQLNVERTMNCSTLSHELVPVDNFLGQYYNFKNIRIIGDALRRFGPDLVLAFNLQGLGVLSVIQYLQSIRIPLVLHLMDNIFGGLDASSALHRGYERIFGQLTFSSTTQVIAMSKNVAREVKSAARTDLGEVVYIPGWVRLAGLQELPLRNGRRGPTKFVFCSRVAPHKGTLLILEAVERLVRDGHKDFGVDIFGAGEVASFMQSVKSKGLSGHICYRGSISKDELLPMLANYDALLFPTWEREAFGFVASEAAVMGALPVMTAGIGAAEWFLDGIDSIKISRTGESLRCAMRQIMSWSSEELIARRTAAMRAGRENFDFDRWIQIVEQICERSMRRGDPVHAQKASKGAESAYLLLSSLLRDFLR